MRKFKKKNSDVLQNLLNSNSSSLVKNFIFYFFLFIFVACVIELFWVQKFFYRYVFLEWLVNYSQGLVRRGLTGTFFLFLHKQYNLDIYKVIQCFAYLTFLFFSSIYILKVRQSKKILDWESLMVVLFLPSLILFPIHHPSVIGRKEFFFFFGLLINLFFLKKTLRILNINRYPENSLKSQQSLGKAVNKYCYSLFIGYNLLSIPTALTHEAIIFLVLPLNMMITSSFISLAFSRRQVLLRTLIIYLPTIFVSFLCFIFKGNYTIALGICQSWQEYSHIYGNLSADCSNQLPEVLRFFNISIKDVINEVWLRNISRKQGLVFFIYIFAFFLNIVILMRTSSRILINSLEQLKHKISQQDDSNYPSSLNSVDIVTSFSFKYAFIPFIFSFILYVIALDWGRWFFITSITYTMCLLSPSLIRMEIASYHQNKWILKLFSPIYSTYSKVINYLHNQYLLQRFYLVYFIVLIYTFFVLRIPVLSPKLNTLYNGLIYKWSSYINFMINR